MEHPSLSGQIAQDGESTSLKLIKQTCLDMIRLGWYWSWAPSGPHRWDSPHYSMNAGVMLDLGGRGATWAELGRSDWFRTKPVALTHCCISHVENSRQFQTFRSIERSIEQR